MPRLRIEIRFSRFQKDLKDALNKHPSVREDLSGILSKLQDDYMLGDWIPGLESQVRKVRLGIKKSGIGKRGGYRLIYLVDEAKNVITLLCFHFKPDIELIPNAEIARLVQKASEQLFSDVSQEGSTTVN